MISHRLRTRRSIIFLFRCTCWWVAYIVIIIHTFPNSVSCKEDRSCSSAFAIQNTVITVSVPIKNTTVVRGNFWFFYRQSVEKLFTTYDWGIRLEPNLLWWLTTVRAIDTQHDHLFLNIPNKVFLFFLGNQKLPRSGVTFDRKKFCMKNTLSDAQNTKFCCFWGFFWFCRVFKKHKCQKIPENLTIITFYPNILK